MSIHQPFKPAWWLPGPHLQTLWTSFVGRKIKLVVHSERLELPDGDFLDLSWVGENKGPIVCVLHGLNGSIESSYAQGILQAISKRGWRAVLMHFRGCSGVPNRLPRSYHAGETGDLATLIHTLMHREPGVSIAAIGYSLGGNVLLKWLGETGLHNPLKAAIAVSVPFDLAKTADHLKKGFSRVYQWKLLRELNHAYRKKWHALKTSLMPMPLQFPTFCAFDHAVTAPLHGFESAKHYYKLSSSRQYLAGIKTPTLILHARNDPFTTERSLPTVDEISDQVVLEFTEKGGHVGFITGRYPWNPIYWLEDRILNYLESVFN
jgi:predicted alpha/beta-fold hydrolase